MKKILFIHQSAELYGSDKTLLLLLQNLDKTCFYPVVILPTKGPLVKEFEKIGIEVEIVPVLKLYRDLIHPKNILFFLKDIRTGLHRLNYLEKKHQFDLVYSNTLAVLLGVLFSWKKSIPHIWHVHEIIEKPKFFKKAFIKLLSLKVNKTIIFNSYATQKFWFQNKQIKKKSKVVWNGIDKGIEINEEIVKTFRKDFFQSNQEEIIIGLVGRISRWKGQMLLLNAFRRVLQRHQSIKLVFVGEAPPNQDHFRENLVKEIENFNLKEKVLIIPFQENIKIVWEAINIAVVPSTEPEPFGMVAIEAMDSSKPVIGAKHGGLQEIIIHNKTGFLFEPNNLEDLSKYLEKLIENEELRKDLGENGKIRVDEFFTDKVYSKNIEEIIFSSISI